MYDQYLAVVGQLVGNKSFPFVWTWYDGADYARKGWKRNNSIIVYFIYNEEGSQGLL